MRRNSRPFAIILAIGSFCFAITARASPPAAAALNATASQPAARPSGFPASISNGGQSYARLTGAALVKAVRGKSICPTPECNAIGGGIGVYREDGTYLEFGDRWEGEGTYVIRHGTVVVQLESSIWEYAFYRNGDAPLLRAIRDRRGIVRSGVVFTK